MINELIFSAHVLTIAAVTLLALAIGKEALVGLICVEFMLMNIFVIKQITLFTLPVTATDCLAVGITLSFNVLQEYFGQAITKKTIWISFFTSLVVMIMALFHLQYAPNEFDITQQHFVAILQFVPRIVLASFAAYLTAQHIDRFLYEILLQRFGKRFFIARNYATLATSQLLDTILFSFLGLYGIVQNVLSVIIVSYTIKMIVILTATPFVALSKRILKFNLSIRSK